MKLVTFVTFSLIAVSSAYAKPLTEQQKLMMYGNCRATHSDKDLDVTPFIGPVAMRVGGHAAAA